MTSDNLLSYACTALLGVVIYFLKGVMSRLSKMESKVNDHETKIEVSISKHNSLDKRIDEVNDSIKTLVSKIDTLLLRHN